MNFISMIVVYLEDYETITMASRTCWKDSGYVTHSADDYCEVCCPLPNAVLVKKPGWLQRLLDNLV